MSKTMFSDNIVESDAFLDMPLTAQALYLHLGMNADNDGFVNPKRIMRMVGAAADDLNILIAKRFIIGFDSGVVVIKHWWINNTKRSDRHVPTSHFDELKMLSVKPNKSYTLTSDKLQQSIEVDLLPATNWQPSGNHWLPQDNAIQCNTRQYKPRQPAGNQPAPGKPGGVNKLTGKHAQQYAHAVKLDNEQNERAARARDRTGKGYETFASVGKVLKKQHKAKASREK